MIIGIDLGTTNSLAAVWRDGAAELIPNALGAVLTPSAVSVADDGAIIVGAGARERLSTHPDRTAATLTRRDQQTQSGFVAFGWILIVEIYMRIEACQRQFDTDLR
jgi:molecular chaperone HscC